MSTETVIYEAFVFYGENRVVLLCVAFPEEGESVDKHGKMKNGLVSTFLFVGHASNAEKPHPS